MCFTITDWACSVSVTQIRPVQHYVDTVHHDYYSASVSQTGLFIVTVYHNYSSVSVSQTGLFVVTVYHNSYSVSVSQTGLFIVTVHHKTVLCLFHRVIESLGPSNTRKYVVAVYFRGERLATGTGHSIQQAEMSAATNALKIRAGETFCRNC